MADKKVGHLVECLVGSTAEYLAWNLAEPMVEYLAEHLVG